MVRKELKFLLLFSCGLLILLSISYAFRYHIQIFKVVGKTSVQTKVSGTEPSSTNGFKCPDKDWVGCMPVPGEQYDITCSGVYLDWARQNCPIFKGTGL